MVGVYVGCPVQGGANSTRRYAGTRLGGGVDASDAVRGGWCARCGHELVGFFRAQDDAAVVNVLVCRACCGSGDAGAWGAWKENTVSGAAGEAAAADGNVLDVGDAIGRNAKRSPRNCGPSSEVASVSLSPGRLASLPSPASGAAGLFGSSALLDAGLDAGRQSASGAVDGFSINTAPVASGGEAAAQKQKTARKARAPAVLTGALPTVGVESWTEPVEDPEVQQIAERFKEEIVHAERRAADMARGVRTARADSELTASDVGEAARPDLAHLSDMADRLVLAPSQVARWGDAVPLYGGGAISRGRGAHLEVVSSSDVGGASGVSQQIARGAAERSVPQQKCYECGAELAVEVTLLPSAGHAVGSAAEGWDGLQDMGIVAFWSCSGGCAGNLLVEVEEAM